jgi:hypothetical protein
MEITDTTAASEDADWVFINRNAGTLPERFRIQANGNVGIGTASPVTALDVVGAVRMTQNLIADEINPLGVSNSYLKLNTNSASRPLIMEINSSEKMRVHTDGNVGIGTSSPTALLHVAGDARIGAAGATSQLMGMVSSGGVFEITTSSSVGKIHLARDVGIGTSSPDMPLTVVGNTSRNAVKIITSGTGTEEGILYWYASDASTIRAGISGNVNGLDFKTGASATQRMRIDSSGDVGIGTAAPDANLQVRGSGDRSIAITSGTAGAAILNFGDTTTGDFDIGSIIYDNANNSMQFKTNNGERMRIDSSGRLLINGTSANTQGMLQVFFNDASSAPANYGASFEASRTNSSVHIAFENPNGVVGSIQTLNSATSYNTSSDGRLKNILGEAKGLEVINKLNPVNFEWKKDKDIQDGLIAQEVKDIVPNAVSEDSDGYYQMDYSKLVTPLIKAVQEQQEQIESLKSEIELLKGGQ